MSTGINPERTLLPVVQAADNFPASPYEQYFPRFNPKTGETYTPFHLTFADYQAHLPPVGYLRPDVLKELLSDERDAEACPWQAHSSAMEEGEGEDLELKVECVFFAEWVVKGGCETMGKVMQGTAEQWRAEGKFPEQLGGWRNEQYRVYASKASSALKVKGNAPFANFAFALERSACAIFGLATFGVHLTAYEGEGKDMKIWVPRRSATKPTYPSMLDNTVAGGIPTGMKPLDAMIKECDEEASLPEDFVKSRLKCVGVKTYFYITQGGYLHPDSPEYIKPKPHDDEVESFALWPVDQVLDALHNGEFKPNCGMILVDFMVRHGFVTPENEPNYLEISWRMHRRLAVGVPM